MGKDELMAKATTLDKLLLERDIKRDLQVILHIMINKNITSTDEINYMRNIVETNSPTIKSITKEINELQEEVEDGSRFLELFAKFRNKNISESERLELKNMIDNNPKKYGSYIYDIMK